MGRYEVLFTPVAEEELEALLQTHPALKDLALRYVDELAGFPPDKWVDVHRRLGSETFKSDNHLILDIQGMIQETQKAVVITRFRLRRKG